MWTALMGVSNWKSSSPTGLQRDLAFMEGGSSGLHLCASTHCDKIAKWKYQVRRPDNSPETIKEDRWNFGQEAYPERGVPMVCCVSFRLKAKATVQFLTANSPPMGSILPAPTRMGTCCYSGLDAVNRMKRWVWQTCVFFFHEKSLHQKEVHWMFPLSLRS